MSTPARGKTTAASNTGSFAPDRRGEPDLTLSGTDTWKERLRNLASGYVPSTPVADRGTRNPADWWDQHFITGEYGELDGSRTYPKMPDDNTPSMSGGQSLSGHRRTYRMSYSGHGTTLQMPSVSAVRRFAADPSNRTFDIPVTVTSPSGAKVSGWVRASGADNRWACKPLGFKAPDDVYVGEAVSAVLESRRPTRALADAGDLMARHLKKVRAQGTTIRTVESSWVGAMGYDPGTGVMVMTTQRGDQYGFKMTPEEFTEVASSRSPGKIFNQMVKGRKDRVGVEQCPTCQRWLSASGHSCAPSDAPRPGEPSRYEQQARGRAINRLFQRLSGR